MLRTVLMKKLVVPFGAGKTRSEGTRKGKINLRAKASRFKILQPEIHDVAITRQKRLRIHSN